MNCGGSSTCSCGCCAGTSVQTPVLETNPPGQSSLVYRVGSWATFKESMLAQLSSSQYPALAPLTTRDDDDFTIAFLDASSVVLDILTFYQERLANESYLRTAQQQQSLVELSRLIGYQPSPGVSASAYLAFTLKAPTGQPSNPANPTITIPQGTQVQSVPTQGQSPQTFETFADIQAKSDWNTLNVQSAVPWTAPGTNGIYLSGTNTQLKLGDSLLILGVGRETWIPGSPSPSEQWDMVIINEINIDTTLQLTYVAWDTRLTHESGDGTSGATSAWTAAKVFAFRQRAALFGHNAPDPDLFVNAQNGQTTSLPFLINDSSVPWQWNNYQITSPTQIDLDAVYQKVVVGSWFALTNSSATTQLLVLGDNFDLWLEQAPLGSGPQFSRIAVDTDIYSFQALSSSQIFVLTQPGTLYLESAPFGTVPPARVLIDTNINWFQALSDSQTFALDNSQNLYLEQVPTAVIPFAKALVDTNVITFQAFSASQLFVLGSNGNLWLEQAPFGTAPPARIQVDTQAYWFQALSLTQVCILGYNYNLWIDFGPFGTVPPAQVQVDSDVYYFQAMSVSQIFVLDVWGDLWLEEAPLGSTLFSRVQVDQNIQWFQAISSSQVLVTDTSNNSWMDYGPFGSSVPPARVKYDATEAQPVPSNVAQVYKVQQSTTVSQSKFGLSAKVSELTADYADPSISTTFGIQQTQVWAQSEELAIAEQPLDYPLYGSSVDIAALRPDLAPITGIAITGNRQKLTVALGVTDLSFVADLDGSTLNLNPEDTLTLTNPAPLPLNLDGTTPNWSTVTGYLTLNVEDSAGRTGTVSAQLSDFTLADSSASDPVVSEYAAVNTVATVASSTNPHTLITLQTNLVNCYDRNTTTVNANTGLATQGQSVAEIMGNGSASTQNQFFNLKQTPLTFIQAPTPTGSQSSLQVNANGTAWTEVPSLYNQGSSQQVFATLNQPGGNTEVLFGDGVEGATLPTGQNNIMANYRIGLGLAGNVGTGTISSLIDRPLGVTGVINPGSATGGQDPDTIADTRTNAPQTVLTLGRAVSITDYQNYASTFAGISKAYAVWIPNGPARGVFLTVAGVGGAAVQSGGPTFANLQTSLQSYGNPLVPIRIVTFIETLFGVTAFLKYAPTVTTSAAQLAVQALVLQALYAAFSFAQRSFGQGISADEVSTVIQAVEGVVAVNVTNLTIPTGSSSTAGDLASMGTFTLAGLNSWLIQQVAVPRPASGSPTWICPYLPVGSAMSVPLAAEILVLNPDPNSITFGTMS